MFAGFDVERSEGCVRPAMASPVLFAEQQLPELDLISGVA